MAVVKAISTQELAALANRLRLTLIRDRMEEMLTMAVDKKLSPRETLEFFFRQEIRRREENRIRQGITGSCSRQVCRQNSIDIKGLAVSLFFRQAAVIAIKLHALQRNRIHRVILSAYRRCVFQPSTYPRLLYTLPCRLPDSRWMKP